MVSTYDELEEIERSARLGPTVGRVSPVPVVKSDRRRGSFVFTGGGAMMDYKNASASPSPAPINDSNLLEPFPKRVLNKAQPAPLKPPQNVTRPAPPTKRGVALKSLGQGGMVDFDHSDHDDSDEEDRHDLHGAPMPDSKEMVGGPNHRTLVGGFAAAAYEASRAHHYAQVDKDKPVVVPKRRGPPPSI